jgi:hypothetical protein
MKIVIFEPVAKGNIFHELLTVDVGARGVVCHEVFCGIGIETEQGQFGIAERDGGIEVLLNGKLVYSSTESLNVVERQVDAVREHQVDAVGGAGPVEVESPEALEESPEASGGPRGKSRGPRGKSGGPRGKWGERSGELAVMDRFARGKASLFECTGCGLLHTSDEDRCPRCASKDWRAFQ